MKRSAILGWLGAVVILLTSGCAPLFIPGPTSGRSRLEQVLLSTTIDEAVNEMTQKGLDPLTGKRVYVRVSDLEDEGRTADSVRATVEHRLASLGVVPVDNPEQSDAFMIVRVRTAGVDRARPGGVLGIFSVFSFLFYTQKVWAAAEMDAQAIQPEESTILLATRPSGSSTNTFTEWSILPILFGSPLNFTVQSSSVNSPLLD